MRPLFEWKLRSRSMTLGERTRVMGVINVTPDSFSDGGEFFDHDRAIEHGIKLLSEGADILDIGGESTRPGRQESVTADEEKRRVLPVIEGILRERPDAVLSIDTYKADAASAAIEAGVEIVNDVSGFTWDEPMLPTLAKGQCGCVLMHTRGRPEQWRTLPALSGDEVVPLVLSELRNLAQRAITGGIVKQRIVLDPGFGFGKRLDENFPLLAHFAELHQLGFPLLSGVSRKSFIANAAGDGGDSSARLVGSIAAAVATILQGTHIIRVHDVGATVQAARVADAILQAVD